MTMAAKGYMNISSFGKVLVDLSASFSIFNFKHIAFYLLHFILSFRFQ